MIKIMKEKTELKMQRIPSLLTIICLYLSLLIKAWADEKAISPPQEIKTEKKIWIQNMQDSLPILLCNKEKYFIQCFKISEKECQEFTRLLVKACLNNINLALPQEIDKSQGEYWGQMVGRCSYDLYEKFMQPKKRAKNECKFEQKKEDLPKPSQAIP